MSTFEQRRLAAALVGLGTVVTAVFAAWHAYNGRWLVAGFCLVFIVVGTTITTIALRQRPMPRPVVITAVVVAIATLLACLPRVGQVMLYWGYPLIVCIYFLLGRRDGSWVAVPTVLGLIIAAALMTPPGDLARFGVSLVLTALCSVIFADFIERQYQRLETQALQDPLTGLGNRRRFMEEVGRAVSARERHGYKASLLIVDVDHFKTINDRFGHDVGDRLLTELARVLVEQLRGTDRAFRIGGEEFAVLLPDTEDKEAPEAAERLLALVSEPRSEPPTQVSVSIGVATLAQDESAREWLRRADDAMYAAKSRGRGRYTVAAPQRSPSAPAASDERTPPTAAEREQG